MPVNQQKLNTKLNAIRAKDAAAIAAAGITIPFLNSGYTSTQLQAWIDKRITRLEEVATKTDAEILAIRNNLYNGLNTAGKEIADKIIAGENFTIPGNTSSANYDRLIGIILITFVLE